ncbi:hypothetical protein B566_EDAN007467 [Ephemera danica]|nr:hypothetical protein B566_EDAN007467 [Ephemera danica]
MLHFRVQNALYVVNVTLKMIESCSKKQMLIAILILGGLTILILILESYWTNEKIHTRFSLLHKNATVVDTCWLTEDYEVIDDCQPCTAFELTSKSVPACVATGYKQVLICKNSGKVLRGCDKVAWIEERNFWIFEGSMLLAALISCLLVFNFLTMDNLYLETYSQPDEFADGTTLVPLETLISLFMLSYCDTAQVKITLVLSEQRPKSGGFRVRCRHAWLTKSAAPFQAQSCVLPVVVLQDNQTCVAGLCAVLRQVVRSTLKVQPAHHAKGLLGFRDGCLLACAEVSTWTRFCEVDMICTVKSLVSIPNIHSPVTFPTDLARFEVHMSQPLRIHNLQKIAQDHAKRTRPNQSSEEFQLEHCFAEGPSMTLSDIILFPCVHIILQSLQSVYLRQYLPLTHKWFDLLMQQIGIEDAVTVISLVESKIEEKMFVEYLLPQVPNQSLYKSDPRRYRPKDRLFTRQAELDESLLLVPCEPEWDPEPFGWDMEFDWGAVPPDAHPKGGQLPVSRLERKSQQLENLAKAVLKLAQPGDIIVDFCSGAGHLGIILAHFLPRCNIILLENKEESLKRARHRVLKLNLTNVSFYQCNLDYFKGFFNIGVSLHACGVATDLVLQCCIQQGAAFVSCPCCYGSVQDNHVVSYPRSKRFRDTAMTLREYLVIGHSADQTHDEQNHKTIQGRLCMGIIDMDRCLQASEAGYQVHMAKLVPESCTPKNNLLVGLPKNKISLIQ